MESRSLFIGCDYHFLYLTGNNLHNIFNICVGIFVHSDTHWEHLPTYTKILPCQTPPPRSDNLINEKSERTLPKCIHTDYINFNFNQFYVNLLLKFTFNHQHHHIPFAIDSYTDVIGAWNCKIVLLWRYIVHI